MAYRNENNEVIINLPEKVVPTSRMDIDLPGYAWDLLPFKETSKICIEPHVVLNMILIKVSYASLQTKVLAACLSVLRMINLINRNNNDEIE